MDLLYMTDVMAYQSARGPVYDKYTSWEREQQTKTNQIKNQKEQRKNNTKEPCKICQERRRRSLMNYIRSKSHDHSEHNIKEEEEEDAQEATEQKEETKR